jgi:hypothetical protein
MNAAPDRRAALAAGAPTLFDEDLHVLMLYRHYRELKAVSDQVGAEYNAGYNKLPTWAFGPHLDDDRRRDAGAEYKRLGLDALDERREALCEALTDLEAKIEKYLGKSVVALAVGLLVEIRDPGNDIHDLLRASLAAIRPQLIGAIAEDADRVLAEDEEATR